MSESVSLRIAVEGCGHGTLDAIYASVKKSCEIKGWDGVDLLIICGDFQAVRNHADLNVTAMPPRYRQMGDFHQYYHGSKVAPYLTVFIGGNHEASNHLFELHYGGWATPNIFYLGAANVVKIGPLKIASTSGTYKRYDYNKPHFERLPYNDSNLRSIYHQRALDIRKLLSYSSQVDIGLSHDWPSGIEWHGNHRQLFKMRPHFRQEAEAGEFGSRPAADVLDRLRPQHWFSAHHHFQYTAFKVHVPMGRETSSAETTKQVESRVDPQSTSVTEQENATKENKIEATFHKISRPGDAKALSAWSSFKDNVKKQDAQDKARDDEALRARIEERKRTGQEAVANYTFEENFKEVNISQSGSALHRQSPPKQPAIVQQIPQLDGSCFSVTKRRRISSPSDEIQPNGRPRFESQTDGAAHDSVVANPDAIDLDLSDSESDGDKIPLLRNTKEDNVHAEEDIGDQPMEQAIDEASVRGGQSNTPKFSLAPSINQAESQNPSTQLSASPQPPKSSTGNRILEATPEATVNGGRVDQDDTAKSSDHVATIETTSTPDERNATADAVDLNGADATTEEHEKPVEPQTSDIPDEIRAQLAEMSSTFAPQDKEVKSPDLPFPEAITNTETRFLALSKVEKDRSNQFLQLLEIKPIDAKHRSDKKIPQRPYRLEYDDEWLAITRVFASELVLGGSKNDKIPSDKGQTYYRDRILEEKKWVQENIVDKGLLTVPENFEKQVEAEDFDTLSKEEKEAMPREVTNPQTTAFCELVGIPNPFDISEEERDARMSRGPPPDEWVPRNNNDGGRSRGGRGGGGGGRGGGRGRGGRGGGGGGRGRWARGRGRF